MQAVAGYRHLTSDMAKNRFGTVIKLLIYNYFKNKP